MPKLIFIILFFAAIVGVVKTQEHIYIFIGVLILIKLLVVQYRSLLIIIRIEFLTVFNCLAVAHFSYYGSRSYLLLMSFMVLAVIEGVLGVSIVVGLSRSKGINLFLAKDSCFDQGSGLGLSYILKLK